jgi:hypothetical protein
MLSDQPAFVFQQQKCLGWSLTALKLQDAGSGQHPRLVSNIL